MQFYDDDPGRPLLATRLMAGLAILKAMHNFSDEGNGCCSPNSNVPILQFLCGEEFFQHRLPFGCSPLTRRLAPSRFGTASRTWKLLSPDIGADLEIDTASSSAPSASSSLAHHATPDGVRFALTPYDALTPVHGGRQESLAAATRVGVAKPPTCAK